MSSMRDLFTRALREADTCGVEMSANDWALTVGVAHDYGHGLGWDLPKDNNGQVDLPRLVTIIENAARSMEEEYGE